MDLEQSISNAVKKFEGESLDAFEVVGLTESALAIEAKRQMVDSFCRSRVQGIALRALKKGRMGTSTTADMSPRSIGQAVKQALDALRHVAPSEEAVIPAHQDPVGEFVEPLGRSFAEIPDGEKIKMAFELESAAIAADSRIIKVACARYEERIRRLYIVNSNGISVGAGRGLAICFIEAVASNGTDKESAAETDFTPRFEEIDALGVACRAARRAVGKLGAERIRAGYVPVVLDSRTASEMLKLLAPSFFADNVLRGKSPISRRRGEKVYNSGISVVDDGLMPGGFGSFPFDWEGIPRRRTVLVEGGVIKAWLYDSARAARDGATSTGNSSRQYLSTAPGIDVGNCFIEAGMSSPDQLIRDMRSGVLITDLLGAHTANIVTGDFSLGAQGMMIEGGVAAGAVHGFTIAGNVHDLLGRVAGVGNDLRFIKSYGAPSLLVEGLALAG